MVITFIYLFIFGYIVWVWIFFFFFWFSVFLGGVLLFVSFLFLGVTSRINLSPSAFCLRHWRPDEKELEGKMPGAVHRV
jgi:hypothetical protein